MKLHFETKYYLFKGYIQHNNTESVYPVAPFTNMV